MILLDLVECSNEKGLGPISRVYPGSTHPDHGVRAWKYLTTPHWRGRWHGTGCTDPPPLLSGQAGQRPTTPSAGHPPPPRKLLIWDQPRWNLTSASKSGSEVTVLTQDDHKEHFWLKRHLYTRSDSWARDQCRLTSALLYSSSLWLIRKTRPGRYNQNNPMAGRYGPGVYIRILSVPSPNSATTLGGDHTFRHMEQKHYQRDQRKNRLLWRFAG